MDQQTNRKVSAQETTIQDDSSKIEAQYECPICLNWLDEPVLTKCGHRFCKKCIASCLKTGKNCPLDNEPLNETDIFPDNFTRREIQQILRPCTNAANGCNVRVPALDYGAHLQNCTYGQDNVSSTQLTAECPFKSCGCNFIAPDSGQMDVHIERDMHQHLSLLMHAFTQNKAMALKSIEAKNLWDAPSKSSDNHSHNGSGNADHDRSIKNEALLSALYERIVILEQLSREQSLKIDRMVLQVNQFENARHSGGVLVWKIDQFHSKIQEMSRSPNKMYYSPDVYTGPLGYRFCARINISPKATDNIGLHVHMMQSDNDYHLDWPFRGCIKIWMIHRDTSLTQHDKIMSNEKILAFSRPKMEISPRGFGFIEYANIDEIRCRGFVQTDTLTVKLHISIV